MTTTNSLGIAPTSNQIPVGTGTGFSTISSVNDGVLITSNTGVPSWLANSGTAGYVLTANTGAPPSWQASSAGSITVTGDSGSLSGSTITLYTDNAALNCGSTVLFSNTGTTSTLNVTDLSNNTLLGSHCGTLTLSGSNNCGYGAGCLNNLTSGHGNCGFGENALNAATSGFSNIAIGNNALQSLINSNSSIAIGATALGQSQSSNNIAIGTGALSTSVNGTRNTIIGNTSGSSILGGTDNNVLGQASLNSLTTGSYNLILGSATGRTYISSESSNILLNNSGTVTESNVLRIGAGTGTGSQQISTAYISGIAGGVLSAGSPTPHLALVDTSDDQIVCPTPVAANTASTTFGSLVVGTALQNTANYPILVNVSMAITASTAAVILFGVDSSNTPTAKAVTASFTVAAATTFGFSFVVPAKYYAKVTTTGTITVASITTSVSQIG